VIGWARAWSDRRRLARRARQCARIRAPAWEDGLDLVGVSDDRLDEAARDLHRRWGDEVAGWDRRVLTRRMAEALGMGDPWPE